MHRCTPFCRCEAPTAHPQHSPNHDYVRVDGCMAGDLAVSDRNRQTLQSRVQSTRGVVRAGRGTTTIHEAPV